MFTNISHNELPVLAQTIQKETNDTTKTLADLELIDDLLVIMKSKSLMNRKSPTLKKQIESRLHLEVTGERLYWNSQSKNFK